LVHVIVSPGEVDMCHLYTEQSIVGIEVGALVGLEVVGGAVGRFVGVSVGFLVGLLVGGPVGNGALVGDGVAAHFSNVFHGMDPQQA